MEGELGSGARIAIALIVIGVIISVIFGEHCLTINLA